MMAFSLIIFLCLNLKLIKSSPISYPKNSSIVFNINNSIIFTIDLQDRNIANDSFQNNDLICDPNLPCTIFCDFRHACYGAIIACPINHQCHIMCTDSNSCQEIEINSPQNHSLLNLEATGTNALLGFVYPPYAVDDHLDFELNCGVQFQFTCRGMDVICPAYASCTINCIGYFACGFVKSYIFSYSAFIDTLS